MTGPSRPAKPSAVLVCSVTEAGAALASGLPYEHHHGGLADTVRARWDSVEGLVLICAAGIAVRTISPLLGGKGTGPAVVCVDDRGRYAIPLVGGHRGGNDLARDIAALLGAEPVVTTATDGAGLPGLDTLVGFRTAGDVAGVTRRWLEGTAPDVTVRAELAGWPLPDHLAERALDHHPVTGLPRADRSAAGRVLVTDAATRPEAGEVILRPQSLVVGVGSIAGADPSALRRLLVESLAAANLHPSAIGSVATLDRKAAEGAIVELAADLGVDLRAFPAPALAPVAVPNPSSVVEAAVGTASVAEAAALLAAGPGATLIVTKQRSADATVAVARRRAPVGHLAIVGLGPGHPSLRTPAASAAVRHAGTVIGFDGYVDLIADLVSPRQRVIRSPIGAETTRSHEALHRAAVGEHVALVCSGDAGVYAMASLVLELAAGHGDPPVTVIPGVTAALAAAAVLGAPLGHDHAAISLSDLLTPWDVIARRVRAAAEADFVVSLYNPRSQRRAGQLGQALAVLGAHRPPGTPAAIVHEAGRPGQRVVRTTVAGLDPAEVDMLCLVVVGASTTRWIGKHMVTPRGYHP